MNDVIVIHVSDLGYALAYLAIIGGLNVLFAYLMGWP
jgi:hypothetical protein